MTDDDYLVGLGKVIGNFHALEHVLRIFLCEANNEKLEYPKPGQPHVAETHLTNRKSLGPTIEEYNSSLKSGEQQYQVEKTVVEIRDSLAHGRVASDINAFPVTLYKFGTKDSSGQILVERVDVLTESWFSDNTVLLRKQIDAVIGCSKSRSYRNLK